MTANQPTPAAQSGATAGSDAGSGRPADASMSIHADRTAASDVSERGIAASLQQAFRLLWSPQIAALVIGNVLGAGLGLINFWLTIFVGNRILAAMSAQVGTLLGRGDGTLPPDVPFAYGVLIVALPWVELIAFVGTWAAVALLVVSKSRKLP